MKHLTVLLLLVILALPACAVQVSSPNLHPEVGTTFTISVIQPVDAEGNPAPYTSVSWTIIAGPAHVGGTLTGASVSTKLTRPGEYTLRVTADGEVQDYTVYVENSVITDTLVQVAGQDQDQAVRILVQQVEAWADDPQGHTTPWTYLAAQAAALQEQWAKEQQVETVQSWEQYSQDQRDRMIAIMEEGT